MTRTVVSIRTVLSI